MLATPLDFLLLGIVFIGLPAWSLVASRWYAQKPAHWTRLAKYWLIAIRGTLLSALVIVAWWKAGRAFSVLGLHVPVRTAGRVGFLVDIAIIVYYLVSVQFRRRSPNQLAATQERLRRLGSYDMLPQTRAEFAMYPIVVITGSTCEELLYRGYLLGGLSPLLGAGAAVLCSSALFGLGHLYQGRIGVLRTTVIGLVFGVAFAVTHSLWWLMIAHTCANMSGVLLARRMPVESIESVRR